jgi:hypothetical protein
MSSFSPETIFERGRRRQTANQPRFYELLRQLIPKGVALTLELPNGESLWMSCAPASKLEERLFLAYDLAVEGEAGLHRIEFEAVHFTQDTWGWLLVAGFPMAEFRPIAETEDQILVDVWNTRSGQPPIQLVAF